MKKLLLIALLIVGCASPPTVIPEIQLMIDVDFTEYTQKDFLFTPNIYKGDYESIGLITLYYYPEAKRITKEIEYLGQDAKKRKYEDQGGGKRTRLISTEWVINEINSNALLDSIYSTCFKMGADAFTQLKIIDAPIMSHALNTANPVSINGIKIEGYAIKRLGAFK